MRLAGWVWIGSIAAACQGSGGSCTIVTGEDGASVLTCPDGTSAPLISGQAGADGERGADGFHASATIDGGVLIGDAGDCEAVSNVREITGLLIIDSNACQSLSMPALERVGGPVFVVPSEGTEILTSLSLPKLQSVGGQFQIVGGVLEQIDLSAFTTLEAPSGLFVDLIGTPEFTVADASALTDFKLGSIAQVAGSFQLDGLDVLETLPDFKHLKSVEGVFYLADIPRVAAVDFPALEEVADSFVIDSLAAATGFDFPKLHTVGSSLEISSNVKLESVQLPEFTTLGGDLYIENNPKLCDSVPDAIEAGLQGWTGMSVFSGNKSGC